MAKLYFRYGAMNSGKSTSLLQVAFNYRERDQEVLILKPALDTKDVKISSRTKMVGDVNWHISSEMNLIDLYAAAEKKADCILVDESQFLTPRQVEELFYIATNMKTPVICYGLRNDFRTKGFPGSTRLLELAHSIEELKTICRCGSKAVFNGRKKDGTWVSAGTQVAIDDGTTVEYESMCGSCYIKFLGWEVAPQKDS